MMRLIGGSVQQAIAGLHLGTLLRRNAANKPVSDGSFKRGHFVGCVFLILRIAQLLP